MDWIRISDSKLKIMLSATDMAQYELHNQNISVTDRHVRRVLRRLLTDAQIQTGFDGDMNGLYVQMYPSADGGCELFISKAEADEKSQPAAPLLLPASNGQVALCVKERYGRSMCAYSFSNFSHLLAVCRRLSSIGFDKQSSAYVDAAQRYYLILHEIPHPSLYMLNEYCFLGEYGTRENARTLQSYLGEYCTQICTDNAVQTLKSL